VIQTKKNILLLASLTTLSLVSLILFLSGREVKSEIDPTIFKLPDTRAIDKVTIEKPFEKIELQFLNGGWRVSSSPKIADGQTPALEGNAWGADRDLVDVLFATMEQVVPKRSVASRIQDSIVTQIKEAGIKVSFLSKSDVQKSFSVLGNERDGVTYFLNDGKAAPYMMAIPGYRVYVAGIFEQNANTWRDKRIFNFNWRNFNELKAEFPRTPKQDFTVAMTGRYFSIVGENKIDTAALNDYLDGVSLVGADAFYNHGESAKADSLSRTDPVMIITVKDVGDNTYSLKLFSIGKNERNALALWNNDLVWFDRRNILPLYKMKKDFVK
jgi:hypothetical protein